MKKIVRSNNICQFCEREKISDKVRGHCHSTGKDRGPAHKTCNINFTQKQFIFVRITFLNFSYYDCHHLFKMLVDKTIDKVNFDNIPKTIKD